MGATDRGTNEVAATVIQSTDVETLQGFVKDHPEAEATMYTDDGTAYESFPFKHETVEHSLREHVKGDMHTNGIESVLSMLKRTNRETFHKPSLGSINSDFPKVSSALPGLCPRRRTPASKAWSRPASSFHEEVLSDFSSRKNCRVTAPPVQTRD